MIRRSLLVLVLCVFSSQLGQPLLAVEVTIDFQSAPIGPFSQQLIIPDGLGGLFALIPKANIGSTYEIVDENGDREIRLFDVGSEPGGFKTAIVHSGGWFAPLSGGEYEAAPKSNNGSFYYWGSALLFADEDTVSSNNDTPIIFIGDGGGRPTLDTQIIGNALSFPVPTNTLMLDVDDLRFDVASPEPGATLPLANRTQFIEEPAYEDKSFLGFNTFAMRVESMFDWKEAELDIQLTNGSMNHLSFPFAGPDVLGPGDTGVFGPTDVLGDLSTRDGDFLVLPKFTHAPGWCSGDFNADGIVDGHDYILWNQNKFQTPFRLRHVGQSDSSIDDEKESRAASESLRDSVSVLERRTY